MSKEVFDWFRGGITVEDALKGLRQMKIGDRAGNCHEYSAVGVEFGIDNSIPNIWLAEHPRHEFLLLADFHDNAPTHLFLNQFVNYIDSPAHQYWVCDPWFNIACPMSGFLNALNFKTNKWENEGKEILQDGYIYSAGAWAGQLYSDFIDINMITDNQGASSDFYYRYAYFLPDLYSSSSSSNSN